MEFRLAGLATLVVLGGLVALSIDDACQINFETAQTVCAPRYAHMLNSPMEELGKVMAGVAGILAAVWLIAIGSMMRRELAAQRMALEMQTADSQKLSKALSTQIEVLREHGALMQTEQKVREEARAEVLLDRLIDGLLLDVHNSVWGFKEPGSDKLRYIRLMGRSTEAGPTDQKVRSLSEYTSRLIDTLTRLKSSRAISEWPKPEQAPTALIERIERLRTIEHRLPEAEQARIASLGLETLHANLIKIRDELSSDKVHPLPRPDTGPDLASSL